MKKAAYLKGVGAKTTREALFSNYFRPYSSYATKRIAVGLLKVCLPNPISQGFKEEGHAHFLASGNFTIEKC